MQPPWARMFAGFVSKFNGGSNVTEGRRLRSVKDFIGLWWKCKTDEQMFYKAFSYCAQAQRSPSSGQYSNYYCRLVTRGNDLILTAELISREPTFTICLVTTSWSSLRIELRKNHLNQLFTGLNKKSRQKFLIFKSCFCIHLEFGFKTNVGKICSVNYKKRLTL